MINIDEARNFRGKSGVYRITLINDGRCYIGSSIDLGKRVRSHYTDLKSNIHKNIYLQRAWNKYGERSFIFDILEVCDNLIVLDKEQYWIDFYESFSDEKGFNIAPVAGSTLGLKKTPEQIENNVIALRYKRDTNLTPDEASEIKTLINKGVSLKEIAKIMDCDYNTVRSVRRGYTYKYVEPQIDYETSRKSKLTEGEVIEIKKKLNSGKKVKELANEYDVSHRTISAIKNEKIWKDVGEKITAKKRKSRNIS